MKCEHLTVRIKQLTSEHLLSPGSPVPPPPPPADPAARAWLMPAPARDRRSSKSAVSCGGVRLVTTVILKAVCVRGGGRRGGAVTEL